MTYARRLTSLAAVAVLGSAAFTGCATGSGDATPSATASTSTSASAPSSAASPSTHYADATAGSIHLTQGYVFATGNSSASATPMPMPTGPTSASAMPSSGMDMDLMTAAYATLQNTGTEADALVSVDASFAHDVQLHETVTENGAGKMQHVDKIEVPAGGTAALKPGGNHVMLMQLTGPLPAGTTVELTWHFSSGATITTSFPVINRADRPA